MTPRLDLSAGVQCVLGNIDFTALDLFLFSAAGWHPHRIHFDVPYAESEGHPSLVVHGPLQAVHLLQALAAALPNGAHLTGVTYRHTKPMYLGTSSTMHASVTAVDGGSASIDVWLADDQGARTTSGTAAVTLPA